MAKFSLFDGGKQVVSCSTDKTVRLWSPIKGECLITVKNGSGKLPYHEEAIQCFALHPSRPLILTGGADGSVFGAHYQTGEISGIIGQHTDSVESVALSEDLQMGVSAGIDKQILIYDLKGLTVRHRVVPSEYGGFTKVMFSTIKLRVRQEGEQSILLYAASTLGDFYLIDVRSGEVIKTYKGHAAPINEFIEVRQRKWIVTAGDDNQCNIFQLN